MQPLQGQAANIALTRHGGLTGKFPNLTREEAYMIASVAVDYHVTQVVDGAKGVHGMIPKSIFKQ